MLLFKHRRQETRQETQSVTRAHERRSLHHLSGQFRYFDNMFEIDAVAEETQGDESIRSSCSGRTVFVVYDDRLRFYCLVVSENRYASIQFRPQFGSPRLDALHTEHVFALRNILEMKEAIDLRNETSQFRAVGAV
jgi:hypothetical protein